MDRESGCLLVCGPQYSMKSYYLDTLARTREGTAYMELSKHRVRVEDAFKYFSVTEEGSSIEEYLKYYSTTPKTFIIDDIHTLSAADRS